MAYEQGILKQKNINRLQRWALSYHLAKLEEKKYSERDEFVKILTRLINPELFEQAFGNSHIDLAEEDGSGDEVFTIDDIDDISEFLKSLEKPQVGIPDEKENDWI